MQERELGSAKKIRKEIVMARVPKKIPAANQPSVNPPTEVEAYGFIRERLRALEWIVKNPSLATGGQVWTQNQCLSHPEIKQAFD